jgi:hypothetical protein
MIAELLRPALLTIAIAAVLLAPAASRPQAQTSTGDPVTVSFLAVGKDGRPVADLKAEEVQLRVNGKPRTLKSLERVDATSADGAKPTGPPLPAPFGSNVPGASGSGGRTIFLLIEDASFRPGNERLMKQAIDQFLNSVSPSDRIALSTLPHPTIRTEPTTAAEVRKVLARVAGVATQDPSDNELACRSRETLEGMRALLLNLAASDMQPTVIFFSSGLSATTRTTGAPGTTQCDLSTDHFQSIGAAASAARAHVYVVQADLVVTQRSDGLENVAGVTGAQVMVLTSAGENALSRIALETSSTYVAAFDPEPSERNGQNHRLELRVARPDVTTRTSTQLPIARTDTRANRKSTPNPRDMLREPTVYRDLPLRLAAFPSRDAGDKVKVIVIGETTDPAGKISAASVGIYDAKGRLTAQSTADAGVLAAAPMTFALVVPAGRYRVRLAATDGSGRAGTADYDLPAELVTAAGLKLSALVLGVSSEGFKPLLEFRNEPAVLATFELYGKPPASLPLRLELAASPDGPALQQAQPSGSATKDPDRFVVAGTFQIGSLAPGDYVVRAIIGNAESGEGRLTRTLRKVK